MRQQMSRTDQKEGSISQEDLRCAAEALVDAAICCHQVRGRVVVTKEKRIALIEAVYNEPELTGRLFSLEEFPLH